MLAVQAYSAANKSEPMDRVMKRVKSIWTEAKNTYQIHEPHNFKLALLNHQGMVRLRSCGVAGCAGVLRAGRDKPLILLRLNKSAIEQNIEAVLSDVIPHEIAHIVCEMRPQHGDKHDGGWAKVCKRLGGTGLTHYPAGTFDL